jgi:DNA-directed RNA polymerase
MIQATLDRYMQDEGVARYRNTVTSAKEREEEASTRYGQTLLSGAVMPFADAVSGWLKAAKEKGRGAKHAAYRYLNQLKPEIAAFVAARGVLDSIGLTKPYARASVFVGSLIEDEVRFAWLQKNHGPLMRRLERQLSHCMSYDHKRTVIVHAMNKLGLSEGRGTKRLSKKQKEAAEVFQPWPEKTRATTGMVLIDLMATSTQLVEVVKITEDGRTPYVLRATEKTCAWICSFNEHAEILDPVWLPMVEPPADWVGPYGGGYSSEGLPVLPLVKRSPRAYLEGLSGIDMPEVYASINALQKTSWQINRRVLGVMEHLWKLGRATGGLPQSDDAPIPAKPQDIETNEASRKEWKHRAARVHADNAALRSNRLQAVKLMNLAKKFQNTSKFYFPYQLDFRGRVYTVPTFLTPQGSDLARSLLLFGEGVAMLHDDDAYWLAVYGANLFGKDKITFEERVAWVKENEASILAVGKDPLGCQWWTEADEAWQFLAWCIEWTGWRTQGPGFKTHLPVCLDGTNNGLQILSMLTRDEVAALATNVLPNPTPADIYGEVARRVVQLMQAEELPEKKPFADYWLAFGINRKTTKRPVMVLPYGGTFHSCRDYVRQWYEETAKARGEDLPTDFSILGGRIQYLATKIWEGIEFCVGRPRQAMTWFQSCADVYTKAGLPIQWSAPTGFPVLQAYRDFRDYEVETTLGDRIRTRVWLREETPNLSKARQRNGISPNVVHSYDGAALTKTVSTCLKAGINHYCMIHDSYGTHAPRVHDMAAALRLSFLEIFRKDQLGILREQLQARLIAAGITEELPPVPAYGSLDIERLPESEFFFA